MQQGKPLGLSKNARLCICPARRERSYGGIGGAKADVRRYNV